MKLSLPSGFEFECPLCASDEYEVAPHIKLVEGRPPIYKCKRCTFHFSEPGAFAKPGPEARSYKSWRPPKA